MNRGYKTPKCQESRNLYTHVVGILSDPGPDICAGGMYSGVHQFRKFSSPKAAVASCRNSSHPKHEILLLGPNEYCPGSVKLGRILSRLNAVTLGSIGQKLSNLVTICSVGHFMFDRFNQCGPFRGRPRVESNKPERECQSLCHTLFCGDRWFTFRNRTMNS
jgi:hypothetical protein